MRLHTQYALIAMLMIGVTGCGESRLVLVKCIVSNDQFIVITENELDNVDLAKQNKNSNSHITELPVIGDNTYAFVNGIILESDVLTLDDQVFHLSIDDNGKYIVWSR